MDCATAQGLLSEAADGRLIDAGELAEARTHCETCESCDTFARGLDLLSSVRAPAAPEPLVRSILDSIAAEKTLSSSAGAEQEIRPNETPEPPRSPLTGTRDLRPSWWVPRLTVFATAAVFMVAALTLAAIGYLGGFRQLTANKAGDTVATADQELAEERTLGTAPADGASMADKQTAEPPVYASLGGNVYVLTETTTVDESLLVTVAPVADSGTGDDAVYAYDAGTGDGSIVIRDATSWTRYERVLRRFAGRSYQLQTRTPLKMTAQWPDLPAAYPTPSAADGSPTFRFFGHDELGVSIFVPSAGSERNGFAIAADTASDDPAAGNPQWTWWAPLP